MAGTMEGGVLWAWQCLLSAHRVLVLKDSASRQDPGIGWYFLIICFCPFMDNVVGVNTFQENIYFKSYCYSAA